VTGLFLPFCLFSSFYTNIEYLIYSLSCADGGSFFNIEYQFYSFVLRGRRIEGLAGAKPLYELPRLLRLLLGLGFAYGSLGC